MPALGLDFERTVHAMPADVRRVITGALTELGFQVTAEQFSRIEARRGSKWLSGALLPARNLPIAVSCEIAAAEDGTTTVAAHLADQLLNIGGKAWGWNQSYRHLFGEILARVDAGLARLDRTAAPGFTPARFWSNGGEIALLEQAQSLGAQAGATVLGKANELLEGGSRDVGPAAWKGVDAVTFLGPKGEAVLSLAESMAHLGIGVMLAGQPGALPPNLQVEVERFAVKVETALANARGQARVEVTPAEHPVFEFLHQQVRIRDGLPMRTLHTCRTCRFQKVTNEDFERLQARNQRLRGLVGGVGAFISPSGIQPFVVLGQLFRLKKLDPDYVCPRCQGMDADERVITFCPSCGEMRTEAVLRICAKCSHDFRSTLAAEAIWLSQEAAAALRAPAAGVEAAAAAGAGTAPGALPQPLAPWGAGGASAVPVAAPSGAPSSGLWVVPPPPGGAPGYSPASGVPTPPELHGAAPGALWGAPSDAASAPVSLESAAPTSQAPAALAPMPPVSASAAPQLGFCPFCGARLHHQFVFCPGCGARLDALRPGPGGTTG